MLQIIREKSQGFLAWGIVAVIVIVFSLWGLNYYSDKGTANRVGVAAKVDGRKITWREIEVLADRERQYYAETNPQLLSQIDPKMLIAKAKQSLIQQLALDSQTKRLGFNISEQQIAKHIKDEPAFQEDGKFSAEKLKNFLTKISETDAMFTENVRTNMLINQAKEGLQAASFIFDSEVNNVMELVLQQRDFGYLIVPANKFVKTETIKPAAIKEYFEQHKQTFTAAEKIKLSYIELTLEELAKAIPVTEHKLQEFYKKHEALYTVPEEVEVSHILINAPRGSDGEKSGEAKAKIDDILAKIKLGENFAALAKKYSDDTITGAVGGKLGKIGRGQTVPEFEMAAFALAKSGDVSNAVQTEYGYHVIKLGKKHESFIRPYASVRKQLIDNYRLEVAESQFAEKGEELANLAFEFTDSLQHAAEKLKLPIQETALFAKNEGEGVASVPGVITAAFSADMLAKTRNSDLIKIDDERYVVIRVQEHVPTKALALAEVTDKITGILTTKAAQKQAEEFGKALLAKLNAGNAPYTMAKEAKLEWNLAKDVERNNAAKVNAIIVNHAFALPKPVDEKPINVGFTLPGGDYAVLSLQTVKASAKVKADHLQEQFHKQLATMLAQEEFNLYAMTLINKAKVKEE